MTTVVYRSAQTNTISRWAAFCPASATDYRNFTAGQGGLRRDGLVGLDWIGLVLTLFTHGLNWDIFKAEVVCYHDTP